jgi:hypothetical protein
MLEERLLRAHRGRSRLPRGRSIADVRPGMGLAALVFAAGWELEAIAAACWAALEECSSPAVQVNARTFGGVEPSFQGCNP